MLARMFVFINRYFLTFIVVYIRCKVQHIIAGSPDVEPAWLRGRLTFVSISQSPQDPSLNISSMSKGPQRTQQQGCVLTFLLPTSLLSMTLYSAHLLPDCFRIRTLHTTSLWSLHHCDENNVLCSIIDYYCTVLPQLSF